MKLSVTDKALSISWSLIWLALPLSSRWTVFFLWLFGIAVIIQLIKNGFNRADREQMISFGLYGLFLFTQIVSLLFDSDTTLWWKALEKKAALIVIPALLLVINQKRYKMAEWALRGFYTGLTIAGILMISMATIGSFSGKGFESWTYHEFASPLNIGAIYLSWYYAIAIIFLVSQKENMLQNVGKLILTLFILIILFLLASKLFILLTIPFVFWKLLSTTVRFKYKIIIIVCFLGIVSSASIPFMNRMSELNDSDFTVLEQDEFTYDTPFNGLTLRLLQWRFAYEILNSESAWVTGVGINSTQAKLDNYYKSKGIYVGNPELGDTGYLGYNYHNQYLETLVGSGIAGLGTLLLIIISLFYRRNGKLLFPLYVYLISALFFFTESVLDRQAGIILFCLIAFTLALHHKATNGSRTDATE